MEQSKPSTSQATLSQKEEIPESSKNRKRDILWIVAAIVLIGIFAVIMWFFYGRKSTSSTTSTPENAVSDAGSATVRPTSGLDLKASFRRDGLSPFPLNINPFSCSRPRNTPILMPPDDFVYIGFHLDWSKETPLNITRRLEYNAPSVINAFIDFGNLVNGAYYDTAMFDFFAQDVSRIKGMLQISVIVHNIETIPDSAYTDFAQHCFLINRNLGVPIFLRYGPEMNGPWMEFGLKPIEYKQGFIKMTNAIRARTNLTAMMWTPNVGYGYPFNARLTPGTPNFLQLDTNNDGIITNRDDPYGPYYPGDEYVDWVGFSSYWYSDINDYYPLWPYFQDTLNGNGPILNQLAQPNDYFSFYQRFARDKNKPLAIAETGAPVSYNDLANRPPTINDEVSMKRGWWQQLWSPEIREKFPLVKLILNFEEAKFESGRFKDWRVTWNQTVLKEYITDVVNNANSRIVWSTDIVWNCTGYVSCYAGNCKNRQK